MTQKSLLIQPIPYPDESAGSFLIRAAEANGFSSVYSLCYMQAYCNAKTLSPRITQQKKFHQLIAMLGLDNTYSKLAFKTAYPTLGSPRIYLGIQIPEFLFRKDAQTFCPECLKEKLYWRRHWLLRPYTVCTEHHTLLHKCCPNCQKILGIGRNQIHICNHCGQDLRLITSLSKTHVSTQWFMDLIATENQQVLNQMSEYWCVLEKFDELTHNIQTDHSRLNLAYEYCTNYTQSIKRLSYMLNNRSSQIHPLIQVVYFKKQSQTLHDYANAALAECIHINQPTKNPIEKFFSLDQTMTILDISYIRLKNLIKGGKLTVIKGQKRFVYISSIEIERVLLDGSHKAHLNAPRGECVPKGDLLTLPEIASQLQIHKEVVRDLGVKGWLKLDKKKVEGYVRNVALPEVIQEFSNHYISIGTLARQLNVNSTNLADKLKHFGIEPIGGPHIDGLRTNLYRQADIKDVTTDMINNLKYYQTYTGRPSKDRVRMVHYESDPTLYLSMRHTSFKLRIGPSKVAVLVQKKILKKDELCHSVIRVEKASIYALIKELHRPDFISLQEAAKKLNCAINWLHINWIKTGYLTLYDFVYWQFVSTADIDQIKSIQNEYMTAIEASTFLGMHRTHIINLKSQGLINSIPFGESNSLHLYKREDVIKLAEQGYGKDQ